MAWIESSDGKILFVKQALGSRFWTLPGGKVKDEEPLTDALRREVLEETALRVAVGLVIGVLDRPAKNALTVLFSTQIQQGELSVTGKEIEQVSFCSSLPSTASPSARFFWANHAWYGVSPGSLPN